MCDVVISGIGGLFPRSENFDQFQEKILKNEYLIEKTSRWKAEGTGVGPYAGQISYKCFDGIFFGLPSKASMWFDILSRLCYERAIEAVIDSGVSPDSLAGSTTNVYAGFCFSDFIARSMDSMIIEKSGYSLLGSSFAMAANRISFMLDCKGQSYTFDSSGTSFQMSIQMALDAILTNVCDAAIIVIAHVARNVNISAGLQGMGLLSDDVVIKSFDKNGTGTVRSDGCVALFLQRADLAKRCYARVLGSSSEMVGSCRVGDIVVPGLVGVESFLRDLYQRTGSDPGDVAYIEGDGMGWPVRDEIELTAYDNVFGRSRSSNDPLRVGSVQSNVGFMHNVNAGSAICKAVIAMENGVIPATINCTTPNDRVAAVREGRMQVVSKNTPMKLEENTLVGITSIGIAGDIGHVILKPNLKKQQLERKEIDFPVLVVMKGRSEDAVSRSVQKLMTYPFNTEFLRLVQDVYSPPIRNYTFCTFAVLPPDPSENIPIVKVEKRTIWFVYSGMGSHWPGMGADLMRLPVFRDTIRRLHGFLAPKGVSLMDIITNSNPDAFDSISKSFVGITAIQIALTNVLTTVGLVPHGIIGHSMGEIACGYADNCLTEEQAILASWARGDVSVRLKVTKGMMAAIGLGYKDIISRLPPSVDVACRNSASSCTLSGPAEDVRDFVTQLQREGVFAREVNVSNIAYHSRYIQKLGPPLKKALQVLIREPKKRSSRWISTSVPLHHQDRPEAQLCSDDYLTNNLLNPVLFEDSLAFVPTGALLVEVSPHGLMQAILKRALPEALHVPLTNKAAPCQLRHLLAAIGSTSFGGACPTVSALYPDVSFPVSRGTPPLSSLVQWHHEPTPTFEDIYHDKESGFTVKYRGCGFRWSAFHIDWKNCQTYVLTEDSPSVKVLGVPLFPLSEMLVMALKCLAKELNDSVENLSVVFEDVHVIRFAELPNDGTFEIRTHLSPAMGRFEVILEQPMEVAHSRRDDEGLLVWGFIRLANQEVESEDTPLPSTVTFDESISGRDILEELQVRGLTYPAEFCPLTAIHVRKSDWMIEIDGGAGLEQVIEGLLQSAVLQHSASQFPGLVLPRRLRRLFIDPSKILKPTTKGVLVRSQLSTVRMESSGIRLEGLSFTRFEDVCGSMASCALMTQPATALQLQFVSYGSATSSCVQRFSELLSLAVQLAIEGNTSKENELTVLEMPGCGEVGAAVRAHLLDDLGLQTRVVVLSVSGATRLRRGGCLFACGPGELEEAVLLLRKLRRRGGAGLLLARGAEATDDAEVRRLGMRLVCGCLQGALLCHPQPLPQGVRAVQLRAGELPPAALPGQEMSVLAWRGIPAGGIQATVEAVRNRSYAARVRLVFSLDEDAPTFSPSSPPYSEQLQLGLLVNVLRGGQWGSWHQRLPKTALAVSPHDLPLSMDGRKISAFALNPLGRKSFGARNCGPVDLVLQGGEMALGWVRPGSCRPRADPALRWKLPPHWSTEEAVTVPWAYSLAFFALKEKAQVRRGESVLIQDGMSAVGHAALKVAVQLGCEPIFTTVSSDSDHRIASQLFPKVHVVPLWSGDPTEQHRWLFHRTRGRGVDVFLGAPTGQLLNMSLKIIAYGGRVLHYAPQDCQPGLSAGMSVFLKNMGVFGVTGEQLLGKSLEERESLARAVQQGIDTGHVTPIPHRSLDNSQKTSSDKQSKIEELYHADCNPCKTYIIIGGDGHEWPAVAESLWQLGARHVLVSEGGPAGRYRQLQLQRLGLQLRQARSKTELQHLLDQQDEPVAAIIVIIGKNRDSEQVWEQLSCNAPVLLLKHSQVPQLPTLLRAAHRAAPNTILRLSAPHARSKGPSLMTRFLPRSLYALSSLGCRYAATSSAPQMRELQGALVRARHHERRETTPMVALPPFGVLPPDAEAALERLASRLFCPLMCLESRPGPDLRQHAELLTKAVLEWRPAGALSLLGWGCGVALTLEVARLLEAAGRRAVTFLIGEDVLDLRSWAATLTDDPWRLLEEVMADDESDLEALDVANPASQLDELPHALASLARSPQVESGLVGLIAALRATASHEPRVAEPIRCRLHLIQTRGGTSFDKADPNITLHRAPQNSLLDSDWLAQLLNDNAAWPRLASDEDVRSQLSQLQAPSQRRQWPR